MDVVPLATRILLFEGAGHSPFAVCLYKTVFTRVYNQDVQQPTRWPGLFQKVGLCRHFKSAPGGTIPQPLIPLEQYLFII